jgi:multiple sugar transport system permease protein
MRTSKFTGIIAPGKVKKGIKVRQEEALLGFLFTLPVLIVMVAVVYYPLVKGFFMSLSSLNYAKDATGAFVGLQNYILAFHNSALIVSVWHTFGYMIVALVLEVVLGILMALVLNQVFVGRGIVMAIMTLPWALPGVVSGLLWSRIFSPDNGILNSLLFQLHLIPKYQLWFANSFSSITLIGIVHAWSVIPLTTLIFIAGLQTIQEELYNAAQVDGASMFQQFRYITLPLLRPSIAVVLTIGTVSALSIFDQIYVLNGTALSTRSIQMQIYLTTFKDINFGVGTAMAFLLTLLTILFSFGYIRGFRRATL